MDHKGREVVNVSPRNHFLLTPLLASASVGTLDARVITEPVRNLKDVQFYQCNVRSVDFAAKTLLLESALQDNLGERFNIDYDKLVISVGSFNNTFGVPDVAKHCFFLKETNDSHKIRRRIIECFEFANQPNVPPSQKASLLNFVVVGGGPTGVEFAAELSDFVRQDLTRLYPKLAPLVNITIIEGGPHLLNAFDSKLQDYVENRYTNRGIHVRTKVTVVGVEHRRFTLSDGTTMPFGMALWSTGLTSNPLVKSLDVEKDRLGRIVTDANLRVPSLPDVYALGDCAVIKDMDLPATAQVAQQKGKYLAQQLNADVPNFRPFKFAYKGAMTYVGEYKALIDHPKTKSDGFYVWLLWRSYYWTTAVSWRNKLLIAMHWFLTFVFGRDTSQ